VPQKIPQNASNGLSRRKGAARLSRLVFFLTLNGCP
jgi:hypothetical protein